MITLLIIGFCLQAIFFSYAGFIMGVNLPDSTTRYYRRGNFGKVDMSKLK